MSIFASVKLTSVAAVIAAKKNNDQQRLIANVPTMIDALTVLVDRRVTTGNTHTMLESFLTGYNKYGRLRPNMLATLQDVILQNSEALFKIIEAAAESQSQNTTRSTVMQSPEREPGDESESHDDDDPFA
jgi:hypothetical protein